MGYLAKVKLIDKDTYKKDWEEEGNAEKVLMNAIEYISEKQGKKNIYERIVNFMANDWKAFDKTMTEVLFGKKE